MEVELFVDPEDKDWAKFPEIENETLDLIPNTTLELTTMTVKEAVEKGVIANRVLSNVECWKEDLTKYAGLEAAVAGHLADIQSKGMKAALADIVK